MIGIDLSICLHLMFTAYSLSHYCKIVLLTFIDIVYGIRIQTNISANAFLDFVTSNVVCIHLSIGAAIMQNGIKKVMILL
jgi:hypothetical protein